MKMRITNNRILLFALLILLGIRIETVRAQNVVVQINAAQNVRKVSPYIYGRNNSFDHPVQFYKDAGLRFVRMNGGNNASGYNWTKRLSVHPDWYNNVYTNDWDASAKLINDNFSNMQGMFAFQLLGRVATTGQYNFNDWNFNQSQYWSGVNQNLNGGGTVNPAGGNKALVDGDINLFSKQWPADSSVAILDYWFGANGKGFDKNKFQYWNMDNEVDIWNGTHDWAMPTLISASAFVDRYIELAKKAKAKYPGIKLCGPVTTSEWQYYKWSNENIYVNGVYYSFMEYFIKRLGDEYKATGIKLVDVLDIHNYPSYPNDKEALQGHRFYYDTLYSYPGANGIKTSTGGWDASLTKEYFFKRVNDWLNKYFGPNHGINPGVSEWGTMSSSNPSLESVIYASHLGTFANNGVELFSPWNWSIGMWETLHLYSRYAKDFSVSSISSQEDTLSAYTTINAATDSMTVMIVNRSMSKSQTVTVNLTNFPVNNGSYATLQLSSLPAAETFVSHTQNALKQNTISVNANTFVITVPALSTTAILLSKPICTTSAPIVSPVTYCQNAAASPLTATGTSLKWYTSLTNGTGSATAPIPVTTTVGTTNYYVSQTVNGCEGSRSTIAVTVNALPTSTITTTTPTTFCQGGSVVLTASAGSSYKWMNGTTQVGTAQSYTATAAGSYTVEVTNTNNCKATSSATAVTVNALPTAAITTSTPTTFCQGGSVVLTASSGSSYKWMNGSTQVGTSQSYTATAAGSYTVEVTNANTCKATSTATTVTVNALPTATITTTTPTTFCQGGSVVLTASAGSSYKWMNGTTQVGTAQSYTATAAGSYMVEVTNANGCKATSSATTVTVNALPTAAITTTTPTTFCQGGNVVLTASSGSSYKWMNGTTQVGTAQSYTATTAGSYTVEVTNAGNCSATSTATTVTVNALPTATITASGPTAIPQGGSVDLTANTGSGFTYKWFNGKTQVGTSQTYTATVAGAYTVEVTNGNSCSATSAATTVSINTNQPSVITITSPVANATITGAIDIAVNVTDPDGSITLVEFLDGNTVISTSSTAPYVYTWDNPSEGSHTITVRVTDSNGGVTTSAPTVITSTTSTGVQGSNTLNANIYPNPSNGIVFVDSDEDLSGASIMLIDVMGNEHTVLQTANGMGSQVDVSNLSDGVYILIVKKGNAVMRRKISVIK